MKHHFLKLFIPFLLGLGIVFSFTREMVIAYYYGSSKEVEIYRIAFSIPYALFQSLGTVLIATLLPLYLVDRKILSSIQSSIKKIFLILILISIITLPWQSEFFAPGFTESERLTLTYNMLICWSIVLFAAFIFPMRLILQSHDKKILVSSTSLLFSLFLMILLFFLNDKIVNFELSIASSISVLGIYFIYRLNSIKIKHLPTSPSHNDMKKTINKIILGSFIYILLLSMPRIIDKAIASEMSDGVIANLDYAMNFYVAFGVLIGTSFTIIYAKKIASEYKEKSMNISWLFQLLGLPFILATLISLSIYPYAETFVSLAYYRGAFTTSDIIQVTTILHSFLITLPFMVLGMLLSQIVAAYSIFVLIAVISIKIIAKWIWIKLDITTTKLAIFGESTLVMEVLGIFIIIFIILLYAKNKRITHD